ncbi:MAG: serine/threonine protein kinase [Leptolyngbya sp.]|nr:serine/threonine protein kinase [Candidatus Melainabacteria bacterium]
MTENLQRATSENICSECGQTYSRDTKICPNDGTRLIAPRQRKEPEIKVFEAPAGDDKSITATAVVTSENWKSENLFEHCDDDDEDDQPLNSSKRVAEKMLGQIVNEQYQIISAIGYGGMSIVFRAKDLKLDKFVALKMLLPHLMNQNQSMQRFRQEAHSASSISHPNVVAIHNYGETDTGQPFLIMDIVEGRSLAALIKREKRLEADRALNIFVQLASALSHAHQKGIIHRDLKPSNVLLTELDGEKDICKIVDFGIAKLLPHEGRDAVSLTQTGDVFGSPLYMSPEQCKGERLDHRADIYSMGCLMYESVAGSPPHAGANMLEVLYRHLNEVPKSFKNLKIGLVVPPQLEAIIFKCLAKDPALRYQSMQSLQEELKQLLTSRKSSLLGRLSTKWDLFVLRQRPRKKSEFITLAALAISLVAFLGTGAYVISLYTFADESPIFKQAVEWRGKAVSEPKKIGQSAMSLYARDLEIASAALKNQDFTKGLRILEALLPVAKMMAVTSHWDEAVKAYALALEISTRCNGLYTVPTVRMRIELGRAYFMTKDYSFSLREFLLFQRGVREVRLDEQTENVMISQYYVAESLYALHRYGQALQVYQNILKEIDGIGLAWTGFNPSDIERYKKFGQYFKKSEDYATVLSHFGDVLAEQKHPAEAEAIYLKAAECWKTLRSADNEGIAYLRAAQMQQALHKGAEQNYEEAIKAFKTQNSNVLASVAAKAYSDYLWKKGQIISSVNWKIDYSRMIAKAKQEN